tara:strand:- start:1600 stop:2544 length:945 start_codon:yes stop_codon:yes gene_type:complete
MKIIELILDEAQDLMGIEAISIVENPAIEENFLALKSDEIKLAEINKDKKILMGALLIPNKPIYRNNEEGEYYIYFSKDTVLKASQLYLKNGNQNNSTLEHQHELNGLTLVESWIVEDDKYDKSRKYGLNVPVGTWMGSVKVNNDDVWNEYVKSGKVKGFSIEGYFVDKMDGKYNEKKQDNFSKDLANIEEEEAKELLSDISDILINKKGKKSKTEYHSDYPQSVKNNAKKGLELNKKLNNKCFSTVNRIRANKLIKGKPISVSTIKRMNKYLSKAEEHFDAKDKLSCSTINFLLWGGLAAKKWSASKLKKLKN